MMMMIIYILTKTIHHVKQVEYSWFEFRVFFSETNCHTRVKKPSLPYSLPIGGVRTVGFIFFLMVLTLCEMHAILPRI